MMKSMHLFATYLAAFSVSLAATSLHAAGYAPYNPGNPGKRITDASGDAGTINVRTNPNDNTNNQPRVNVTKKSDDSYMMIKRDLMKDPNASSDRNTGSMTVVEIAANDPSFSTLIKALTAADLISTLKGRGPFTIFAPNDAAFAKLSPNALSDLLKPENKGKLSAILTYHIVPGKILATDIKSMKLRTVNGKPIEIKINGDDIAVNNAKVVKTDVIGTNGVIQVIDTVLMPPSAN
jgi:uncharacterized surface protein with fasciclin (FAS1) repeats